MICKKMKIILTMNLPYTRIFGGANKSNKSLAEEFAKKGHEVIVVAPALATPSHITHEELLAELSAAGHTVQKEDGYYTFSIDGVKIHAVINASKLRNKLIQKVKQENPDWVMISAEDPSQTLLNAAFEAAPDKVIYLAHTPQMFPFGVESMYPGEKRTQTIGKSRLIVTISDFVADYIRSNTGFEVLVNHPPHFGEGPYDKIADFDNKYVLTMNPCGVKGIDIFVGLAEAFPNVSFAYVPGWGTTPSDVSRMEKIPNITQLNNEPDLNDLLKQAKLLLMPTLWSEGFGMATVDAMLRGIPVLASDYGGLKEAKLGTDFSIPITPIQGFTGELDENSLPQAILPKQDLTPWTAAIQELCFDKESYEKQVEVAYRKSHDFISNLSIDKLENWMHENIPGAAKSSTNKIDIKNLTPEQKKKLLLELKKKKEQKEAKFKIKPVPTAEDYALSYAQKRLWILDQINKGYYGYIIPSSMLLQGDLDKQALLKAFKHVIDKHESLRTYFVSINGEPRQKILTDYQFELEEHDFSIAEDPHDTTKIFAQSFNKKLFDLSKAPLLRVALIKIAPNEHVLLFAMHHIISDGWSMKILTGEVYGAYVHLVKEGALPKSELEVHYKDFSAWQNNLIESDENSTLKAYWYRKLGGEITVLNLPTDKPRPKVKTYNGKIIEQTIDEKVVAQIHTFCTQHKISLFAYLTAAVKILLHRYTDQKDIIVGTPTAGRNNSQLENQIGFYVNMLALRDELQPTDNVENLLARVHQTIVEALDHEAYPYDKIVEDLDQDRDLSRSPLFDVMVSIEDVTSNSESSVSETNNDLKSSGFNTEENEIGSSHDLAFIFYRNENELSVNLVYNVDLFEEWKGKQILQHISTLTESLIRSPQKTLTELNYLSPKEEQFLLDTPASVDWPKDWLIHQRFESIAAQFPQQIALSYEGETVTYEVLNRKANQLAHYLREQGVGKNTIVGLLVQRSNDIMTAILAVLKAGGAYLPIDPSYPKDRIDYTLSNSQAQLVVSDGSYTLDDTYAGELINLTDINYEEFSTENLLVVNSPDDLAYIIYTSGSTGWPKGVMISHYNVIRLLFNDKFQFNFNEQDVWTLFHSYCFDFSVWEMYGSLLYGGKLVVVPKLTAQSPREFWQLLQNENVTVLNQTPGAFYNLIEEAKAATAPESSVRYVIFGGEALNPKKLAFWQEHYPNTQLINMYGITETTVHVTFKEITSDEIKSGVSNIGKAIPTLETLVLDKQQRLLPLGVAGELCVGGLGLAKGYLNNPELTATKFIPHPFREGEKLYRSGDLAKILPNGEMEYLGRIDFQVKIRGFRIELGEIENKLNTLTTIEDCLVLVKQDESDDNFLIAYYVSENPIETADLREHLGKQLPDYMIPSFFVHYKNFPLNQNGKVDRKVLINPLEDGGVARKRAIIQPETSTEEKLMELWNEVLKKEESSIDDNFFEVGGHSLKANQLIGKMYRAFEVEIRLGDFFDSPTVRELAELVDTKKGTKKVDEITPLPEQPHYEMSYAQKRMWILEQMDTSHNAYTMPMAFEVKGELSISKLEKSFQAIIARHESLRTTFDIVNNEPRQFIHSFIEAPINVIKSSSKEVKSQLDDASKRAFDLKKGPLIALDIFQLDEKHHYLMLNMHHIVSDGQSMVVLFQELFANYSNHEQTDSLRIQYKDFAAWQNKQLQDDKEIKNYWLEKLGGKLSPLSIPTDKKRPLDRDFSGANSSFDLGTEASIVLRETAKTYNTSLFTVVLSALKVLLADLSKQDDIIVGSPVSGRIHPELENQIGFYVNTLALRDQLSHVDTFSSVIEKVNATVSNGLKHQSYPFERLVEELDIKRDLSRNPLFDVMIVMDQNDGITQEHKEQSVGYLAISSIQPKNVTAKFDLTFGFHTQLNNDEIGVSINYNTAIFTEKTIDKFKSRFVEVINLLNNGKAIGDFVTFNTDTKSEEKETHSVEAPLHLIMPSTPTERAVAEIWKDILKINRVGINQNFFEVGGQSLRAALIINAIEDRLGIKLNVGDVFKHPTIQSFVAHIDTQSNSKKSIQIPKVSDKKFHPLSSAQRRLFMVSQFEGIGTTYNMPGALRIKGTVNIEQLERALNQLLQRHASLRTRFKLVEGEPVQEVQDVKIALQTETAQQDEIAKKLDDFVQPFDLSEAPLLRVKLLTISAQESVLLYDVHHIVSDGSSMEIIIRDLFALYHEVELPELPIDYVDYATWQESTKLEEQEDFWLAEFEAGIPSVNFPLDYPRKGVQEFEGGHFGFEFDVDLSSKLKAFSEQNGTTMYMTLFALFGLTTAKLSNTNEIVLGTPVAGRSHKDLEHLVGMFVNNLALKFQTNGDQLLTDYFELTKQKIIAALDHQDYQFEDLVNALQVPREMGRNPVFDILFTFNAKTDEKIKATQQDLKVEPIGANITTTKFDLTLGASESEDGLHFIFEYAKHLFKTESIERFAKVFELVTQQVLNGAEKIADIDILTSEDKKAIKQFNATQHEPWPTSNLISGFKKHVELSPNALAVADEQKEYTYLDLDQKSNAIASFLLKKGVQKGDVIAFVLPRNADTIAVMFGVMKAGACYLPIDVSHPLERIKFYISDSEAKFSITSVEHQEEIENALSIEEVLQHTQSETLPNINPEDKAYMIYTSGSTGTPKGGKIHHGAITNTIYGQIELFNLTPEDTYLQFASLSFDASITDIYGALLSGAQLVIPNESIKKDPDALIEYCNAKQVTIALLPPALSAVIEEQSFTTLRKLASGGEALKLADAQRLSKRFELFNAYGPTEIAVCCSIFKVDDVKDTVPIGFPLPNTEIYILNEQLQHVPIGTAGEICVAGVGVAEGYYNRPELNQEKFIPNPFSDYPRLYRTGDLGKINANLELEFLGRIDQQIKIRGYRIELGEIEHQLRQIPEVKNAVVTVLGKENKKLVAYCVSSKLPETHVIKNTLSKQLPDYMIPDVFIALDELPMTIGGKINLKALPEPIYSSKEAIVSPQTESQQKIWECWSALLGIENFGVTDNFFELGGNSILAMKVVAKLSMDFEIKVNNLFEHPTIESLAKVVKYKPENVKNKLIQLKQLFKQQQNDNKIEREKINFLRSELSTYQSSFEIPKHSKNTSENILITGALGFLGMYLVRELLTETNAYLILLVRPKSNLSGEERFQEKVEFYFNAERDLFSPERITIVEGDITQEELFDSSTFDKNKIDCIIHTASNTSHFGNWEDFEKVNVKGTEHILKFAEKYGASVHHVSTLSVAGGVTDADIAFFSENHTPEQIENSNYYTQSKIEAEKTALNYKEKVPVSIYRVGNLMPAYQTGMFQENSADNAFMNTLKFYFELGKIPAFTPKIYDFAFIDEVAKSIRLLLNVTPNTYHLSNPNKISDVDLGRLIAYHWKDYEIVEILDLIEEYLENIDNPVYAEKLQAYISNSKALEMEGGLTKFYVSSAKTNYALNQLGFEWKKLTPEYMIKVLQHLEETGFIKRKKQNAVMK